MNFTSKNIQRLTSCTPNIIKALQKEIDFHQPKVRAGRKFQHNSNIRLICMLIKLKTNKTYEEMEAYLGIDSVTIHRYVNSTCAILAEIKFKKNESAQHLIVDSTCTRV